MNSRLQIILQSYSENDDDDDEKQQITGTKTKLSSSVLRHLPTRQVPRTQQRPPAPLQPTSQGPGCRSSQITSPPPSESATPIRPLYLPHSYPGVGTSRGELPRCTSCTAARPRWFGVRDGNTSNLGFEVWLCNDRPAQCPPAPFWHGAQLAMRSIIAQASRFGGKQAVPRPGTARKGALAGG